MAKKYLPKKPDPIKLTQEGYEKAENDLKRLSEYRKEVLVRLQTAREMGDLSENAAYTSARFELNNTDRQLNQAKHLLRWGVVVKSKNNGEADLDSIVILDNGENQIKYRLVSTYESDPAKNKLSVSSPIGQAVMGKKAGDKVIVQTPSGSLIYKIISVD